MGVIGKLLRGCNFLYGAVGQWGKGCLLACAIIPNAVLAEQVTIAALGDSLTQGYGLPQSAGFVPQLQAWLRDHGADVTLLNAGVSGDTSAGGLARVAWTLSPEVDGLIIALGANDMLRGIDPEVTRENLRQIIEFAQKEGAAITLIGMQALGNNGPDYKREFDAIYPELAATYELFPAGGFFRGLGASTPQEAQPFMQADGMHPNRRGVEKIVEAIGPQILPMIRELGGCAQVCTP